MIKKDLVAIDKIVKRIVHSCEGGVGGDEDDGGVQGRGHHGRDGGGRGEYKDCRWDGARNDDISFVSDVSWWSPM